MSKFVACSMFAVFATGCLVSSSGCSRSSDADVATNETVVNELRKPTAATAGGAGGGDVGSGWGTLKGRFTFNGPAKGNDLLQGFDPNKDALCKIPVKDDTLVVDGSTKGMANVLLFVRKAPRVHPDFETAPAKEVTFDQKDCRFLSHVFASSTKDKFVILNSDAAAHNSNGDPKGGNAPYNALIPPVTGRYEYGTFKKEILTPYEITCSIHPWMKAYHIVRADPYFAVSSTDGSFTIPNLPAGVELEFQVWHEKGTGEKGAHGQGRRRELDQQRSLQSEDSGKR
ncbi:MAG: hypothetical protein QM775_12190 [Pirellulales bacterium]